MPYGIQLSVEEVQFKYSLPKYPIKNFEDLILDLLAYNWV